MVVHGLSVQRLWLVRDGLRREKAEGKEETKNDAKEEKKSAAGATTASDKATPKETTSSKKASTPRTCVHQAVIKKISVLIR